MPLTILPASRAYADMLPNDTYRTENAHNVEENIVRNFGTDDQTFERPTVTIKLANNPEFRDAERERIRLTQARRRKEDGGAYAREYRKKNADKIKAQTRNRRAAIKNAEGHHTHKDVKDILRLQNGKCAYCKSELGKSYHVDHIMPLVLGGSNDRRNLQCLCANCNLSKAQYDPLVYARSLGLLL